jgi:hypothetical protein
MARKHAFFIVVLLAAAALAGFVALARSADLAQPAAATATPTTLSQSALEQRLRELDRFEAKLRKQLAAKPAARAALPATVITRAAAPAPAAAYDDDDEHEDEDDDEHEDDDD